MQMNIKWPAGLRMLAAALALTIAHLTLGGAAAQIAGCPIPAPGSLALVNTGLPVVEVWTQKGFDLLLEAFEQIQAKHPEWHLVILGEGPMREELEQLRAKLGLTDRVSFPGSVQDVNDRLRQADLFVMSSTPLGVAGAVHR